MVFIIKMWGKTASFVPIYYQSKASWQPLDCKRLEMFKAFYESFLEYEHFRVAKIGVSAVNFSHVRLNSYFWSV